MAGTKTEEDAKMAKLYFKYGAMGSSKSAQALITKFNYEELGMTVWLIKPSVDTRDGADIIKSRIGLAKKADIILPEDNIIEKFDQHPGMDVIIADECQFFTPEQIDQLRTLVDERDMPVMFANSAINLNVIVDEINTKLGLKAGRPEEMVGINMMTN